MAAGGCGVPGVTALGPAVEGCSIPTVPVITLCLRMEESTVRESVSSTDPATQKPAQIAMVRNFGYHVEIINLG